MEEKRVSALTCELLALAVDLEVLAVVEEPAVDHLTLRRARATLSLDKDIDNLVDGDKMLYLQIQMHLHLNVLDLLFVPVLSLRAS